MTYALPKGRLFRATLNLLRAAGVPCPDEDGRRLVVELQGEGLRFLYSRPSDVPIYVQYGAADIGICGKDTLLELTPEVYEILDLGYGGGRFVLAAPEEWVSSGFDWKRPGLRIATKYPKIASDFLESEGVAHHVIRVHGAAELAPRVGLAEMVFDISATGMTLKENGLVEVAVAGITTARLVANPASYKIKAAEIKHIVRRMKEVLAERGGSLENT